MFYFGFISGACLWTGNLDAAAVQLLPVPSERFIKCNAFWQFLSFHLNVVPNPFFFYLQCSRSNIGWGLGAIELPLLCPRSWCTVQFRIPMDDDFQREKCLTRGEAERWSRFPHTVNYILLSWPPLFSPGACFSCLIFTQYCGHCCTTLPRKRIISHLGFIYMYFPPCS